MAREEAGNDRISVGILKPKMNSFVKKFESSKLTRLMSSLPFSVNVKYRSIDENFCIIFILPYWKRNRIESPLLGSQSLNRS